MDTDRLTATPPGLPRRAIAAVGLVMFALALVAGASDGPLHRIMLDGVILWAAMTVLRQVVLLGLALAERPPRAAYPVTPLVSVIVPACNEEDVIERALASLVDLDYPNKEIIFVDDGSNDATLARAQAYTTRHPGTPLTIISQVNGGKAAALNTGIRRSRGEFILCVDADSHLDADVIRRGLTHFADPRVAAVGGAVRAANHQGLLARFQELEYLVGQNFTRRALSLLGVVIIIPGPVGLFRRQALLQAGGYDERRDRFAEDADITVRLLSGGWRTTGDIAMRSHTEVPCTLFPLLRQRYRWRRGLYQALDANLLPLLAAPGGRGTLLALLLLFEWVLLDIANFAVVLFFLAHALFHGEILPMLSFYLLLAGLDLATLALVYHSPIGALRALGLSVIQRFTYAQLLQAWNMLAAFDEWCATPMDWDKLQRVVGADRSP
jgi:cellulose synthase/poly-beta-1,6-N-acetylglucosamine synthase-like glycosyltransferase